MNDALPIDEAALRQWPLPEHPGDADKEARGRVLVIAGSREMPGAAVLSATAALRSGAGKLTVACETEAARDVAAAVLESRVIALPIEADGNFGRLPGALVDELGRADAVLVGPGMQPEPAVVALVRQLLPHLRPAATLVLDAHAMSIVAAPPVGDGDASWPASTVLTPHAGEMAHLLSIDKNDLGADAAATALRAAQRWNVVVALKGALTAICTPDGRQWCHRQSVPGLGTSGSGDVLAGIIAGLAARGAPVEQAAAWGVALHARAGRQLAERIGPLGYLARELAAEVPAVMALWAATLDR